MTISRFFYLLFYDEDQAREKYMETIQKKQTLDPFDQVLVRDCLDDTWKPDIFLHLNPTVEYKYECTTCTRIEEIPFLTDDEKVFFINRRAVLTRI